MGHGDGSYVPRKRIQLIKYVKKRRRENDNRFHRTW